jgi:hypothetical protein
MTLFNYGDLLHPAVAGDRPWQKEHTSVDWDKITARAKGSPTFATVAGDALDQINPFVGKLGNPIGIASYRPPHAFEFFYTVAEAPVHNVTPLQHSSCPRIAGVADRSGKLAFEAAEVLKQNVAQDQRSA